jgi:hypothetical protein
MVELKKETFYVFGNIYLIAAFKNLNRISTLKTGAKIVLGAYKGVGPVLNI